MGQKITIQNCRIGHHAFGSELHFAPGEVKEVDLSILMKYGDKGGIPSEFKRGEFKVINPGQKPDNFGFEPEAPAAEKAPEPPAPTTEAELAQLLSAPPARK